MPWVPWDYDNQQYQKSVDYYLKAAKLNPKDDKAFYGIAASQFVLGQFKDAETNCKMALKLNSNNTNISTGAPISDHTYANYIAPFISDSSYLSEQANGATNYGSIQNTGANVYAYTFTHDNVTCLKTGITSSSVEFKGNEQLVLTFSSPLATSCILEVYAFCESALEFGETSVVKLTL